jgi:polyphenol oxidase
VTRVAPPDHAAANEVSRSSLPAEPVEELADVGVRAFTTTREAGSFGTVGGEPVREVLGRWYALQDELARGGPRLASGRQVHGTRVVVHDSQWEGWLRVRDADGHAAPERGTAMAITVADCVPVFIAHPAGATALLHSGWRGTADRIVERGILALTERGLAAAALHVHLGPAICGECYEVSPDVYGRLTGRRVDSPTRVDLRALIAAHARRLGVRHITASPRCTRCHNERFFSHRAGDAGRQVAVIMAPLN